MNNRLKRALVALSAAFSLSALNAALPIANAATLADWYYGPTDDTNWKGLSSGVCTDYCSGDSATTVPRCCLVRYKGDDSSVYVQNTSGKKAYATLYSSHRTDQGAHSFSHKS